MNTFQVTVPFSVDCIKVRRLRPIPVIAVEPVEGEGRAADESPIYETLYDGSYEAGVRAGRLMALRETEAARQADARALQAVLAQMDNVLQELIRTAEGHLPDLLMAALGRVFREHDFTQEEMGREVAALLGEVHQAQSITIEIAPDALATLQARVEKLDLSIHSGRIQWKGNADLARGEYMIHTDLGVVDGRRHSKLSQIRTGLDS
ncbi:Flagellar biosynthesis/type III secretory pathway protein FliH [Verrucomicrobium sp. GAS474]|uniref:FliH/SctL family protein n=1 Tax=Verrucomicrobium sp. GAS474 TaxID=1882831 RepID=UPI0008797C2D|nr:FliH/SctL family protein [Verrucomicrobium sp. GAS474]SDU25095.1 Flagellar biosynthesis/type III secretory pathway protein FliH [Verrucomicrobium sp. GAS474]